MGADLEARDLDLLAVASLLALAHPRMQNVLVASQTRERERERVREREREYSQQFIIGGDGWLVVVVAHSSRQNAAAQW